MSRENIENLVKLFTSEGYESDCITISLKSGRDICVPSYNDGGILDYDKETDTLTVSSDVATKWVSGESIEVISI